ncbi:MAG: hypothetical protein BWY76_02038 [bacterium ADurb.Bin429]|nr:MAG: hypothetical protein BWY76_02038 [bacterium ADurb.Bin429]
MTRYFNLEFDEACDILNERTQRQQSQCIAHAGDLTFDPVADHQDGQAVMLTARLLGHRLKIGPATYRKLLQDFGLKDCADALPPAVLAKTLNHLVAHRLRTRGDVRVWHDSAGCLIYLDWMYCQRANMDSVETFRTAFHAISMKNRYTLRRPRVLVLDDLPTHVEVTADCDKGREAMPYDTLLGGVMLRHSEMGVAPTSLYAAIFRAVCSNQLIYGYQKTDPRYLGEMRLPIRLNDVASGLAGSLGSLLNRMRRLTHHPCIEIDEAVPIIQNRWSLSSETADALVGMANDRYLGIASSLSWGRQSCLYDVLNTFTAVTTHRHGRIPQADYQVLTQLSDSLLTEDSAIQRLLECDLVPHREATSHSAFTPDIQDDW